MRGSFQQNKRWGLSTGFGSNDEERVVVMVVVLIFGEMSKLVGWILQLKMQSAKTHSEKLTEVHSHDKTTK